MGVRWKEGKVISLEVREGLYLLAQMLASPYMMFFDAFREQNRWEDVNVNELPQLLCNGVTNQFLKLSKATYQKSLGSATFDSLPTRWIETTGMGVVRKIWEGTEREMTVGYMGSSGGSLVEKRIDASYEEAWGPRKVIIDRIDFDDHEVIDQHEICDLFAHPFDNERLFLCHQLGRVVDPMKDLVFRREPDPAHESYLRLIAEDE